jgi:hypothetical protein
VVEEIEQNYIKTGAAHFKNAPHPMDEGDQE